MNTFRHYAIAGFVVVTLVGSLLNWKNRCAEMRALLAEAEAPDTAIGHGRSVPGFHWNGARFAESGAADGR